ncbi:MAG: rhodanese-like domain-containing protein [Deltaproteobacteria bacterium]
MGGVTVSFENTAFTNGLWPRPRPPGTKQPVNGDTPKPRIRREGSFTLLDVRQPREYEKYRLPGAKLIPLPELSDRSGELQRDKPIIAY